MLGPPPPLMSHVECKGPVINNWGGGGRLRNGRRVGWQVRFYPCGWGTGGDNIYIFFYIILFILNKHWRTPVFVVHPAYIETYWSYMDLNTIQICE